MTKQQLYDTIPRKTAPGDATKHWNSLSTQLNLHSHPDAVMSWAKNLSFEQFLEPSLYVSCLGVSNLFCTEILKSTEVELESSARHMRFICKDVARDSLYHT